jgi:hypothetical protein
MYNHLINKISGEKILNLVVHNEPNPDMAKTFEYSITLNATA